MAFSSESDEPKHLSKGIQSNVPVTTESISFPINWDVFPKLVRDERKLVHVCDVEGCGAKFSRPWRLLAHKSARHSGEKPFVCNEEGCGKQYTSSSHLRRHKATIHCPDSVPKNTFKCTYPGCHLVLKTKQNFKKHYRRAHELKAFVCSMCPETFQKHIQLRRHEYVHTGVPPLRCEECGNGFTRNAELKKHIRGRHRVHICPMIGCRETFKTWSLLRKHVPLHYIEEDFQCEHCSKIFSKKERIRQHIVRSHIKDRNIPTKTDSQNFTCTICEKIFGYKASLKRHIQELHEGKSKIKKEECVSKARAKRKDAGIPRHSVACALSGVNLPPIVQSKIIQGLNCDEDDIIIQDLVEREMSCLKGDDN